MVSRYGAAASCAAALWLCVAATAVHAQDISIVSPASEETVHSNPGEVTVVVSYKAAPPSSMVRILVDGQPAGPAQPGDTFLLQGIERGAHTLQAQLLAPAGKLVAASAPVTFYMWHASILLPQPQVSPHKQ
ncbi:MAG TPA: hypothetical protein VMH32_19195 [Burkholderiales bacterium]|nr:hypothetical protein [Burkholderiales bacterium]